MSITGKWEVVDDCRWMDPTHLNQFDRTEKKKRTERKRKGNQQQRTNKQKKRNILFRHPSRSQFVPTAQFALSRRSLTAKMHALNPLSTGKTISSTDS